MYTIVVPIEELCNISVPNSRMSDEDLCALLLDHVRERHPVADDQIKTVTDKLLRYFIHSFRKNWKLCFHDGALFQTRYADWIRKNITIKMTETKIGRRSREDFEDSSKSTKRRKVKSIHENYSAIEIQHEISSLRADGRIKLANKISQLLNEPEENEDLTSTVRFTDDQTVALIEDAKLSRHQYEIIRLQAKEKNADIYVPYSNLMDAKKRCYPPDSAMTITDKGATIKLQPLLDHIVNRLLLIPEIKTCILEENIKSLKLSLKYGCDGASDQSTYKQKLPGGMASDGSLFMVSMVPIMLESESKEIWKNPHPGSTKLCTPLAYQYAKETPELTRSEIDRIKEEIKCLRPTKIAFGKFRCQVNHKMLLTMLDGKVAQNLTKTPSAASCHLCKANPSEMNKLDRVMQKHVNKEDYELGLSPLHAKIRFMVLILNIAYHSAFCLWQARTAEEKRLVEETKLRIQKEFREEMGLIIDVPKHGAGNSNDENTARRFFRDPELTSEITGVDVRLIKRFNTILQVLSCGRKIDAVKYESYVFETQMYVELYNWYYMSSSVHKILLHGAQIIESFIIPIGLLSEEAQEARNKDFRRFREFNTRKCSRFATNVDLTHKLLISSDAYLAYLRQDWKHVSSVLEPEALELIISE